MEAICSTETSITFQRTTRRYIPENSTLENSFRFTHFLSFVWGIKSCNGPVCYTSPFSTWHLCNKQPNKSGIWGFHGNDYEEYCCLWCSVVVEAYRRFVESKCLYLQGRNIRDSYSACFLACLAGLFLDTEDGSSTFLKHVSEFCHISSIHIPHESTLTFRSLGLLHLIHSQLGTRGNTALLLIYTLYTSPFHTH
jgi:hypothetical protein